MNGSEGMEAIILKEVEHLKDDLLKAVEEMVAIPSVRQKKSPWAPYGPCVKEALLKALEISKGLGFQTKNIHHHIGYACDKKGDDYIGVFGHVDVVKAQGGWQYPPFFVTYHQQHIYGRGVLDDKGPLMAALFALKALKNANVSMLHPIRIIFGCDEENGMSDLDTYFHYEPLPISGFTPDCQFPVVLSEAGRCLFEISGTNAKMMRFLNRYVLGSNDMAKRLEIDDEILGYGRVSIKEAKLMIKKGHPCFQAAIVYPKGLLIENLEKRLYEKLEEGMTFQRLDHIQPMVHDLNEPMVKALLKAYTYVTKSDACPLTTTGGTYAKRICTIVPFGPVFDHQLDTSHQPDEHMAIDDLMTTCKIYALALFYLSNESIIKNG